MGYGQAIMRVVVGALHVGHGAQKVFGAFGGHGPDGTGQFFESAGLKPGKPMAYLAGGSEIIGGTLVALGLATPLGATMLTGVHTTAIRAVHLDKGPWVTDGGYEYNLTLLAALFAVTESPGALAVDGVRGREGLGWAVAQLAAGAGGATLVTQLSQNSEQQGAGPMEAATGGA